MARDNWISDAANKYGTHLQEKRSQQEMQRRAEERERERRERLSAERETEGGKLWAELQYILKGNVKQFNESYGDDVMRTEARADGPFKVKLGEPGGVEKIAALTYAPDVATLTWEIFGSNSGSLTVGLLLGERELQFMSGTAYVTTEAIAQQIIEALVP
ncbi:hypothetical protein [Granulicella tundricola]|uniref:Uncharacterized protein n=1 Tax=Granulicella tundricola (strain ATCC BAA-1859 / DSM 23138 / MP5ACTX9) TaxID=1198114 RepID=E8X2N2_GRATM|nr:hypothetical protein [Granulicella tundricola]ADW70329.1 hypothetical protein AciX9_3320 [Granulicella tundricola MP5ACTX9]